MIAHVDSFGPFDLQRIVSNADCTKIVAENFGLRLRIPEFGESVDDTCGSLTDKERRCVLIIYNLVIYKIK